MINKLLPIFALASMVMLGACSSSKLVQTDVHDDVYYSIAEAKEAVPVVHQEKKYVTEREVYADEDSYSGYYDDYSVRINRFYRYSPWRSYYDYYDPFYSRSPYSYDRYYRPGVNINVHIGGGYGYRPFWNDNYYWGYYGSPYRHNYWGMQSYYNMYPNYGGYYGNGGYYYGGMGRDVNSSPNYRPRPGRDFENIPNSGRPSTPGRTGSSDRTDAGTITDTRSRTERYNDGSRVSPPATTGSTRTSSSRPSRSETERPTRTSTMPTRTTESSRERVETSRPTRTESYTPPPSNSGSSSSGGRSSDSGSSSGGGSSSRPTRGN